MSEEWGPWIEHDGRGCPLPVGTYIKDEWEGPPGRFNSSEGPISYRELEAFDWSNFGKKSLHGMRCGRVIRYRIRKPRGLVILEKLLTDLPETVDA